MKLKVETMLRRVMKDLMNFSTGYQLDTKPKFRDPNFLVKDYIISMFT